jgi:hypothetical protein
MLDVLGRPIFARTCKRRIDVKEAGHDKQHSDNNPNSKLSNDRSAIAVSVAIAAILGVPFLLLSLIDLGKALRSESGGNFRMTATAAMPSKKANDHMTCFLALALGDDVMALVSNG